MLERLILLAIVPTALARAAYAQQPPSAAGPAAECAQGVAAPYARCALWLDGNRVRRGAEGAIVGQPGFFSHIPLMRLVQGDSAQWFAARYRDNARRSLAFSVIGGLLIGGALIVAEAYDCNREPTFGFCTNADDAHALTAGLLLLGGVTSGVLGGLFQVRAMRAASKAIWWHNSYFAR